MTMIAVRNEKKIKGTKISTSISWAPLAQGFCPIADTDAGRWRFGRTAYRNDFRITNFRPDQVSSTAQTFTSTKPSGSASSRIVSSVISVSTFAAFFDQD